MTAQADTEAGPEQLHPFACLQEDLGEPAWRVPMPSVTARQGTHFDADGDSAQDRPGSHPSRLRPTPQGNQGQPAWHVPAPTDQSNQASGSGAQSAGTARPAGALNGDASSPGAGDRMQAWPAWGQDPADLPAGKRVHPSATGSAADVGALQGKVGHVDNVAVVGDGKPSRYAQPSHDLAVTPGHAWGWMCWNNGWAALMSVLCHRGSSHLHLAALQRCTLTQAARAGSTFDRPCSNS